MSETRKNPSQGGIGPILAAAFVGILLIEATMWLGLYHLIEQRRLVELAILEQRVVGIAFELEQSARESLLRIDLGLRVVARESLRSSDAVEFSELTRQGLLPSRDIGTLGVARADGFFRPATADGRATSIAEGESFVVHRNSVDVGLHVGRPSQDEILGRPVVNFSRRINLADGTFAGVAVATIEAPRLFGNWIGQNAETGLTTTIFGLDGIVRARRADRRVSAGESVSDLPVFELMEASPAGTFLAKSAVDGVLRLHAYRKIEDRSLVVMVGLPYAAALGQAKGYENDMMLIGSLASGLLIVFVAVTSGLVISRRTLLRDARAAADAASEAGVAMDQERKISEQARRMADDLRRKADTALADAESARERALEARSMAEAANRTKTEFLASMSHELRTPLNSVIGFAQLMSSDPSEPLTAGQATSVAAIERNSIVLMRLIEDVLDFAKVEAGDFGFQIDAFKIEDFFGDLDRGLRNFAAKHQISLQIEKAVPGLEEIVGDRVRLLQIVTNLGNNAVKYNRPGGTVMIKATRNGETLRIEVADSGLGIPKDRQSEVFTPFKRLGREMGTIDGTGIGLSLSRQLAQKMGGDIGFTSEEKVGSRFWVDIPIDAKRKNENSARASAPEPVRKIEAHDSAALERSRDRFLVLYVEDNRANTILMERILGRESDFELVTAADALAGIQLAKTRRPDVIVMDLNLPGMDGFEALQILKSIPETAGTPVIALTASTQPREVERGMAAGFVAYLTKPIEISLFLGKLREIRAEGRKASETA